MSSTIEENYKEFNSNDIYLIDSLRIVRNKIAYDGFFVEKDYIERRINNIENMIKKLRKIIRKKMQAHTNL